MDITQAILALVAEIRRLREEQGIDQKQFALDIEVHPNYYNRVECHGTNLTLLVLLKICHRLRVSPWRLLYGAWRHSHNYEQQDRNKRRRN